MRFLMVSGANLKIMNGDGVHTRELACRLAAAGHQVDLVLRRYCRPPDAAPPGVEIIGLPVPKCRLPGKILWPALVLLFVATCLFFRWRYDVFYAREGVFELPVILLLRRLGKKVALEVNTVMAEDLRARGRTGWMAAFAGRAQKRACAAADVVLPVTESLAGWVMRQGAPARRVAVVENGADPHVYRPGVSDEAIKKLGLPSARRWFCFAGNLAPWQGVEVILEALALLREELSTGDKDGMKERFVPAGGWGKRDSPVVCGDGGKFRTCHEDVTLPGGKNDLSDAGGAETRRYESKCGRWSRCKSGISGVGGTGTAGKSPDAGLLVVGDGPEKGALEKRTRDMGLADAVVFAGRVGYEDVPVYINACAAGIGGGWHRPAGTSAGRLAVTGSSACKVFAYLSCSVPVIVPDLPGVARLVHREECGLVVAPGDVTGLKEAMAEVLRAPSRWAEAGCRGRTLVEREASWERRAAQVVRAVQESHL